MLIRLHTLLNNRGAYKYIAELYHKKQSDVMLFLQRVRYVPVTPEPLAHADLSGNSNVELQMLGVPSAPRHPSSFPTFSSRQG